MKTEQRTVYIDDAGDIHETEQACLEADAAIAKDRKNTTYWEIAYAPDTTEGRGLQSTRMIRVRNDSWFSELGVWIQDYLVQTYGRPLAFVQGCSPCVAYMYSQSTFEVWNTYRGERDMFVTDNSKGLVPE